MELMGGRHRRRMWSKWMNDVRIHSLCSSFDDNAHPMESMPFGLLTQSP